jgi:hypothetical protein
MVIYSNGKVYKIEPTVEHDKSDVYYGSTTKQYLSQRFDEHRSKFKKNEMNASCSSKVLFQKYGVENCVIILLESVSATTKDELKAVEAKYIINNECVNKNIPLRTKQEWITDNKDKNKEQRKIYNDANKEKIKEQRKIYNDANKDTKKEYQKEYDNKNAEKLREYHKQYYLKKKEQAISENN